MSLEIFILMNFGKKVDAPLCSFHLALIATSNKKKIGSSGLEIATNTVAFATKVFPFATKISGEVTN